MVGRDRGHITLHRDLEEAAWHGSTEIANAATNVNAGIFGLLIISHGHGFRTGGRGLLDLFDLLLEFTETSLEFLLRRRCFLRGHVRHLGLGGQELHGIDGHISLGTGIGDHDKVLPGGLEAPGADADELQPVEGFGGFFEIHEILAIGMKHGGRDALRTSRAAAVGHADFIASRDRQLRREGHRLLTAITIQVMRVAAADEWGIHAGELPLADLLRLAVIDDDSGQIRGAEALLFPQSDAASVTKLIFEQGGFLFELPEHAFKLHELRLMLAIEGQRRVNPVRDVVGVVLERLRAAQDACECVVVACRHGIELVIVAARAADGHAEKGFAEGVELLVHDVHAQHAFVLLLVVRWAESEKSCGGELSAALSGVLCWQKIPRDHLGDHPVERHIIADRLDEVVAEAPRVFKGQRATTARRLRETRKVHEVRGPAFGEGGRGELALDLGLEILELGLLGRKANQIKGQAAEKGGVVSIGRGLQAIGFQLRHNEAVDVVRGPVGFLHGWRGWLLRHLEGPEAAVHLWLGAMLCTAGDLVAGIMRTAADPGLQVGHVRFGELLLGRHLEIAVLIAHSLPEQAFLGLAGDERGAGVTAVFPACLMIETKTSLLLVRAMAVDAMLDEQRADALFKKLLLLRLIRHCPVHHGGGKKTGDQKGVSHAGPTLTPLLKDLFQGVAVRRSQTQASTCLSPLAVGPEAPLIHRLKA